MENRIFKYVLLLFLMLNLVFMARLGEMFYFPGEMSTEEIEQERAQQEAQVIFDFVRDYAREYDSGEDIESKLAEFYFILNNSEDVDDLRADSLQLGREIQELVFEIRQEKNRGEIIEIISGQELPGQGWVTVLDTDSGVQIVDHQAILEPETRDRIKELTTFRSAEIRIEDNKPRLVPLEEIYNYQAELNREIDSLSRQLEDIKSQSGYARMKGQGLRIEIYDEAERLEESSLVHNSDIIDIINELWSAGARGVAIGEQRLTTTSPIRCVGGSILVNNKPVAVHPVTIEAVGNPRILEGGLEIIRRQIESFGLRIEIETREEVILPERQIN